MNIKIGDIATKAKCCLQTISDSIWMRHPSCFSMVQKKTLKITPHSFLKDPISTRCLVISMGRRTDLQNDLKYLIDDPNLCRLNTKSCILRSSNWGFLYLCIIMSDRIQYAFWRTLLKLKQYSALNSQYAV